jgi:hypothetical protein
MEYFFYTILAVILGYIFWSFLIPENFRLFQRTKSDINFDNEIDQRLRRLLLNNFIVYKLLDEKGRKKFEKRVIRFIEMKKFRSGTGMGVITDEMRVLVAASAIQITHGYPEVYFKHFKTIILYASEYYSTLTGKYHKGEVNAAGAIVLSWNNFNSGFKDISDRRNLAMHEMAHALQLTNMLDNEEYGFIESSSMHSFEELAKLEMDEIKNSENSFFRSYGATNIQEFFSVAVECFFECPKEFQTYNPGLYVLMTRILKMDLLQFGVENEEYK